MDRARERRRDRARFAAARRIRGNGPRLGVTFSGPHRLCVAHAGANDDRLADNFTDGFVHAQPDADAITYAGPHGNPVTLPRAYAHLDGNGIDQPEAGNFTDGKDVANLGAHCEGDCGDVDDGETVVIYEPGHRGDSDSDVRELFPGDRDVARSIAFAGGHRHSTASPGSVAKCIAAAAASDRGEERR
jgi:hypothetical protein